ncbi:MAG: methylthioribulose 1-phosphate dehydratase [Candidatus Xenobia bacterium]
MDALIRAAQAFYARGWLLGTSGNLSVLSSREPLTFNITASGLHKGELTPADLLLVNGEGKVLQGHGRPSAETLLHAAIYRKFEAGAVYHVHSVKSALVSGLAQDVVRFQGLEMIKGLDIWSEGAVVEIPVVDNLADIPRLADAVAQAARPDVPGLLVRNHGIYAWGRGPHEARRHVEIIEYLCDYQYHSRLLQRT